MESASSLDGNVPRLNILADRSRFFKGSLARGCMRQKPQPARDCADERAFVSRALTSANGPLRPRAQRARALSIIIVSSPPIVISKMRGLALQLPDNALFLKPLLEVKWFYLFVFLLPIEVFDAVESKDFDSSSTRFYTKVLLICASANIFFTKKRKLNYYQEKTSCWKTAWQLMITKSINQWWQSN